MDRPPLPLSRGSIKLGTRGTNPSSILAGLSSGLSNKRSGLSETRVNGQYLRQSSSLKGFSSGFSNYSSDGDKRRDSKIANIHKHLDSIKLKDDQEAREKRTSLSGQSQMSLYVDRNPKERPSGLNMKMTISPIDISSKLVAGKSRLGDNYPQYRSGSMDNRADNKSMYYVGNKSKADDCSVISESSKGSVKPSTSSFFKTYGGFGKQREESFKSSSNANQGFSSVFGGLGKDYNLNKLKEREKERGLLNSATYESTFSRAFDRDREPAERDLTQIQPDTGSTLNLKHSSSNNPVGLKSSYNSGLRKGSLKDSVKQQLTTPLYSFFKEGPRKKDLFSTTHLGNETSFSKNFLSKVGEKSSKTTSELTTDSIFGLFEKDREKVKKEKERMLLQEKQFLDKEVDVSKRDRQEKTEKSHFNSLSNSMDKSGQLSSVILKPHKNESQSLLSKIYSKRRPSRESTGQNLNNGRKVDVSAQFAPQKSPQKSEKWEKSFGLPQETGFQKDSPERFGSVKSEKEHGDWKNPQISTRLAGLHNSQSKSFFQKIFDEDYKTCLLTDLELKKDIQECREQLDIFLECRAKRSLSQSKLVTLPMSMKFKCIFLDLDETLVRTEKYCIGKKYDETVLIKTQDAGLEVST